MFHELQNNGILHVQDFGLSDQTLSSLAERASELLSGDTNGVHEESGARISATSGGSVITARLELPELEELYQNASISRVIKAYLGSQVTLDGHKLTKLSTSKDSDVKSYIAARWHHDRAGRRIKLFIYLHDVDCDEGHPTQVAVGTHNLLFYRTEDFPTSRYHDSYIRSQTQVVKGCGKRGGGFMFDTHSVHMGTPEGNHTRTTVITEFHNSLKCPATRAMGLPIPCPSGDQYMLQRSL